MMSSIADLNKPDDKDYGQECKEIAMCIGGGRPKTPEPSVEEKEEEMERESQKEEETAKRKEARQDVLEETITRRRKGSGRRSLLRGSGGGIGFYNEYNQ